VKSNCIPLRWVAFYSADQFPEAYRGDLFVASHGSSPGLAGIGYKVLRVEFSHGRPVSISDFATAGATHRTCGAGLPTSSSAATGALWVSDDDGGRIYRVRYGPRSP
jgi:glucose/arabinose dehydrogenase